MQKRVGTQSRVPLERALSKRGFASRTQARKLILAGEVRVNGTIRRDPLYPVNAEKAKIEVGSQAVVAAAPRTFILNKPRGVVTTRADEKGRPTVFSLIHEGDVHLIAVGRLDFATTGLLLITNDTKLAAWLTDPVNEVIRTYIVTVRGKVTEAKLDVLRKGLRDPAVGETLEAHEILLRKSSSKESHLTVQLTEGRNREIRRMFAAIGHEVTRLKRVAYGPLEMDELAPGKYRELTHEELRAAFPDAPLLAAD